MLIGGATMGLLHLILVVMPVVTSGGSGEKQAGRVVILDFPLVWLMNCFEAGRAVLEGNVQRYQLFISVGGTVMYIAAGIVFGYLAVRLLLQPRAKDKV